MNTRFNVLFLHDFVLASLALLLEASDVAGAVPTIHFENNLRSDVSGAVSLITEPELKTTERF